jgi:phosphatidylserine/phosphatidylglycerophosphate/cardiolipin synthase-like enzyme
MNYTVNGAYWYDNNIVRIRSRRISEDYTTEFNEMFEDYKFGADSPANTPYPLVNINNQQMEVYFSPDDGVEERLIALIESAKENIYFLAFSFTSDRLAQAIIERAQAGVVVKGVLDQSQIQGNQGGEYEHFLAAGLDVVPDGNPKKMHDKVMIVDNQIVITGSYNFTASAARKNDENLVVFYSRDLASIYLKEFNRIWEMAYQN